MNTINATKELTIHLFEVDMSSKGFNTCHACGAIESTLLQAIETLKPTLEELNCRLQLTKVLVKSEDEAKRYKVTGSPTITVGNVHLAPQHDINVDEERIWKWKGQKFKTLSKQILIEVILAGYSGSVDSGETKEISKYVQEYLNGKERPSACCG